MPRGRDPAPRRRTRAHWRCLGMAGEAENRPAAGPHSAVIQFNTIIQDKTLVALQTVGFLKRPNFNTLFSKKEK